jgi:hypothetical protein
MPRWDDFARSLAFAAIAAAGLAVAVVFGAPLLGGEGAARLYLIAAASLYAFAFARGRARRAAALACAIVLGLALAVLPIGLAATAVGAAGLVALSRSAFAARGRRLRALAIEAALAGVGLAFAGRVAGGGLLALCLAVWAYFLIQSAYFLFGGSGADPDRAPRDPFEQARARLERLLQEDGPRTH